MKYYFLFITYFIISSSLFCQKWGSYKGLVLETPFHNEVVTGTTITFEWAYYGAEDNINYEMLLGENNAKPSLVKQDIAPTSNVFTKSGFLRGTQYWWRIICKSGDKVIVWVNGYFTISDKTDANHNSICTHCNGSGKVLIPESYRTCTRCNGTGKIKHSAFNFPQTCKPPLGVCGGSGKIKVPEHYESCSYCDGTGMVK
ncbi:MAG: hypothetical protein ACFFDN_34150 [Candidatus Hodarchaeota archaeon]